MTRRLSLIAITGAAAVLLVKVVAAPASTTATRLVGTTGPEWTITMKKAGRTVKTLKPGTYTLTVIDRSSSHNFRLRGPRMNRLVTTVRFVGRKTVTVTFRKGRYTYLCDPHEFGGMKGEFVVK